MNKINLDVFSDEIRELCEIRAHAVQSPVEFVIAGLLSAVSIATGNKVKFIVKDGYFETASIWQVIIAPPSMAKSPSMEWFSKPIKEMDREKRKEHQESQESVEEDKKKKFYQRVIGNATMEAIEAALAQNDNGIYMFVDEFHSFINAFDAYRGAKGVDEGIWNKIYSHSAISTIRKTTDNIDIYNPYATIIGACQPGPWKKINKSESGFIYRFLIYDQVGSHTPAWSLSGTPSEVEERAFAIINRIQSATLALTENHYMKLGSEARAYVLDKMNVITDEIREYQKDQDELKEGAMGKFRQHFLRLALVFEMLNFGEHGGFLPDTVSVGSLERSWCLVNDYFKVNTFKSLELKSGEHDPVKSFTDWQQKLWLNLPDKFKRKDAIQIAIEIDVDPDKAGKFITRNADGKGKNIFKNISYGEYTKIGA